MDKIRKNAVNSGNILLDELEEIKYKTADNVKNEQASITFIDLSDILIDKSIITNYDYQNLKNKIFESSSKIRYNNDTGIVYETTRENKVCVNQTSRASSKSNVENKNGLYGDAILLDESTTENEYHSSQRTIFEDRLKKDNNVVNKNIDQVQNNNLLVAEIAKGDINSNKKTFSGKRTHVKQKYNVKHLQKEKKVKRTHVKPKYNVKNLQKKEKVKRTHVKQKYNLKHPKNKNTEYLLKKSYSNIPDRKNRKLGKKTSLTQCKNVNGIQNLKLETPKKVKNVKESNKYVRDASISVAHAKQVSNVKHSFVKTNNNKLENSRKKNTISERKKLTSRSSNKNKKESQNETFPLSDENSLKNLPSCDKSVSENPDSASYDLCYKCLFCPFSTATEEAIRTHMKKNHSASEKLKCPYCYCKAIYSEYFTHVQSHLSEPPYLCPSCPYFTHSIKHFVSHKRCHQQTWQKAFHCEHCSFATDIPLEFLIHQDVHPREFGVSRRQKKEYKANSSRYQNVGKEESKISKMSTKKLPKFNGYSFNCNECSFSSNREQALERHQTLYH